MNIEIIPALDDNYIYLLRSGTEAIVVDPSTAEDVLSALEQQRPTRVRILITHSHYDHVGGVAALKKKTGAEVFGAGNARIPELDHPLAEGDTIAFGETVLNVLETPGHGDRDLSYLLIRPKQPAALFCGDTLFVSGCGRIFQGSAQSLWNSLLKLGALPTDTEVYCGHEYTLENLRFAQSIDPDDPVYQSRRAEVETKRSHQLPTVPSTLGTELRANPFLRCTSLDEFSRLRRRKDTF